MRALARSIHERHREVWSVDDAMAFAELLMPDRHLEAKAVGIEVVARYRRSFKPRLLRHWKRWLAKNYASNWATTDTICGFLIGPLLLQHPELVTEMRAWARDRNMWVRRAAIVSLIRSVRAGTALDATYEIARRLHDDDEDLIQKAVGWVLREAGKVDQRRLERYLRVNGPVVPRITVRYAIERFPIAKRAALLKATR
jgi:3-methyladenine DNA glycosylase AlkD